MDSRLNAFLERAESVLARLEPLLPALRPEIDWHQCLAARWQREGRSGYLLPLEVSLDMRLSDLIGVDQQRRQRARNTQPGSGGHPGLGCRLFSLCASVSWLVGRLVGERSHQPTNQPSH